MGELPAAFSSIGLTHDPRLTLQVGAVVDVNAIADDVAIVADPFLATNAHDEADAALTFAHVVLSAVAPVALVVVTAAALVAARAIAIAAVASASVRL